MDGDFKVAVLEYRERKRVVKIFRIRRINGECGYVKKGAPFRFFFCKERGVCLFYFVRRNAYRLGEAKPKPFVQDDCLHFCFMFAGFSNAFKYFSERLFKRVCPLGKRDKHFFYGFYFSRFAGKECDIGVHSSVGWLYEKIISFL